MLSKRLYVHGEIYLVLMIDIFIIIFSQTILENLLFCGYSYFRQPLQLLLEFIIFLIKNQTKHALYSRYYAEA